MIRDYGQEMSERHRVYKDRHGDNLFNFYCETFEVPQLKGTLNVKGLFKRERALKKLSQEMEYTFLRNYFGPEYEKATRTHDWMKKYWPALLYDRPPLKERARLLYLQIFKPRER